MFIFKNTDRNITGIKYVVIKNNITTAQELRNLYSKELQFPYPNELNWDAFNDVIVELEWIKEKEIWIIHDGLPAIPKHDLRIYIDIMQDTCKTWAEHPQEHIFKVFFPPEYKDDIRKILIKMEELKLRNNYMGLLETHVILNNNPDNIKNILLDLQPFEQYCEGVFSNSGVSWLNIYKKELSSVNDIDFNKRELYSIEYRIAGNNLFIYAKDKYISIENSHYLDVPIQPDIVKILRKYIALSEHTLIGFELDSVIDKYPNSIMTILEDKALYPLYLYGKNLNCIKFQKYTINPLGDMENIIEEYIKKTLNFSVLTPTPTQIQTKIQIQTKSLGQKLRHIIKKR